MLIDRKNWQPQKPWFIVFAVAFLASTLWFCFLRWYSGEWAGGSSFTGLAFGIVGGAIIVFECFLWVRKRFMRTWRIGRAQTWLKIHIWLGLLCLPLLIMHSGLRWGGWLSFVLMLLLIFVVASGVFGLVLQNILPKRMLDEIPAETIYSQIDTLAGQLFAEADRLVSVTCGTKPTGTPAEMARRDEAGLIVVGMIRTAGNVQGKVSETRTPAAPVADAEALAAFFEHQVASFLRAGEAGNPRLANASQAAILFQNLKTQVPPAAHEVVSALENFCEQRRQWDSQARLHFWLHSWLWVHFPLSVALFVLMFVHVFVALKFY